VDEGTTLTASYTATDANGDPLRFFVKVGPAGASIDSVTGLFTWSIGFAHAGLHTVTIGVRDGLDTTLTTATVTVMNVNRAPVFTSELSSQTRSAGQTLSFTYVATDPDGQAVRYRFVAGPAGATLDSVTGAFSWSIQPSDSGLHVIRVIATDGTLADTTFAEITVPGVTSGETDNGEVPFEFALRQNYPNPFNPSTAIRFSLPAESHVTVAVCDQLGREVSILANATFGAGVHEIRWDAAGMASGLYLCRIEAVGADGKLFVKTNKMVLLR
jgi:hypothetical protein